ncbi:MAG: COX15/CtaA family protein [Phycisphaeraceae bacterium]|nr:COX15/CtaA family protein [Phycisphaeraceae bacterium]
MQPAPDNPPTEHRWLRRFTYLVIAATFALIAIGGKVTSFEYGMAIPGGFTTGGWISFLAPLEYWYNDTDKFWEHTHRIKGTVVGFLTIAMTILLWRTQGARPWLKWMGVAMLLLVCIQGAMGAFRVSEVSLTLAFIHGIVGQVILCSWIVIAAALSMPWLRRIRSIKQAKRDHATAVLRWSVRVLLVLLLVQLTLGSAVRHFKADKAIPDFPLTYGHVLPPMSQESLDQAYIAYYAEQVGKTPDETTITNRSPQGEIVTALSDVDLQFAHRLGAVIVCLLGLFVIVAAIRRSGDRPIMIAPALIVLAMFSAQFALGVMTVLSETEPLMATLHQATGAALIAASTWLAVRIHLAEYAAEYVTTDKTDTRPASTDVPPRPPAATPATA